MVALVAGEIDWSFASPAATLAHSRAGRLRALAVSTPKRAQVAPELPTVAEAGVPGYAFATWYGLYGPAALPREIVTRLNAELGRILAQPDVRQRLSSQGSEPGDLNLEQFTAFARAESAQWGQVIRAIGLRGE
jgi:tripartite-type tricarboxylate transporter receptor subunit TctC